MKCIGNCTPHQGSVRMVTIHRWGASSTPVPYCQAAIRSDIEAGYRVRVLPQNYAVRDAMWTWAAMVVLAAILLALN